MPVSHLQAAYESVVFGCIDAAGFDPVVEMNKTPEGIDDNAPSGRITSELVGGEDGIGFSTDVEVGVNRSELGGVGDLIIRMSNKQA